MYAVIETGGKQYRVKEGDVIVVEKLGVEAGEKVEFDKVLVMGEGADIQVGTPYVGSKVYGTVVENGKGKKVVIFKYKAKKDYRKKQGHRQPYTLVEITSVAGEKAAPKAAAPAAEEAPDEAKAESKPLAKMLKAELIEYAKEQGIEIDEKATKAVIIETIEAAK